MVEQRRTYRASGQFVCFSVVGLVVARLTITEHSHDIGKDGAGSVVLVRVEEDTQTFKLVLGAKDGTLLSSGLGHPHGETITEQISLAVDVELDLDFPVCCCERHTGVDPSGLRGAVRSQADVFVCSDEGVSAKVPPSALEV